MVPTVDHQMVETARDRTNGAKCEQLGVLGKAGWAHKELLALILEFSCKFKII